MHKISRNRDAQGNLGDGAPERAVPGEAAATGRQKKRKYDLAGNRRMSTIRMMAWQWLTRNRPDVATKIRLRAASVHPYKFKTGKVPKEIE